MVHHQRSPRMLGLAIAGALGVALSTTTSLRADVVPDGTTDGTNDNISIVACAKGEQGCPSELAAHAELWVDGARPGDSILISMTNTKVVLAGSPPRFRTVCDTSTPFGFSNIELDARSSTNHQYDGFGDFVYTTGLNSANCNEDVCFFVCDCISPGCSSDDCPGNFSGPNWSTPENSSVVYVPCQ
jgi:hypothetical protein